MKRKIPGFTVGFKGVFLPVGHPERERETTDGKRKRESESSLQHS